LDSSIRYRITGKQDKCLPSFSSEAPVL